MVSSRPGAVRRGRVAALDPHRLLGEPAEELRRVGDLGLRLRERLAHLERHHERELVGLGGDRLVGAAQDLAALARRVRGPLGLDPQAASSAAEASSAWRRRPAAIVSPVDGSSTSSVAPPDASRHSPPMNSCVLMLVRALFS
jgi:hypothetical protein